MEHVAKELKMTPEEVRKVNLYKNGQVCFYSIISLNTLPAPIFEAPQADGIIHNFECNLPSTKNIKILLN